MDIHVACSFTALFPRHEVNFSNVRYEVRMQNPAVIFRKIFPLFGEKLRIAGIESVLEDIICVVDKFRVAVELECNRLTGKGKIATGLGAGCIEMLMPGVERDGEGRSAFPFKGPLRRAIIPYGGGAASRRHS